MRSRAHGEEGGLPNRKRSCVLYQDRGRDAPSLSITLAGEAASTLKTVPCPAG